MSPREVRLAVLGCWITNNSRIAILFYRQTITPAADGHVAAKQAIALAVAISLVGSLARAWAVGQLSASAGAAPLTSALADQVVAPRTDRQYLSTPVTLAIMRGDGPLTK